MSWATRRYSTAMVTFRLKRLSSASATDRLEVPGSTTQSLSTDRTTRDRRQPESTQILHCGTKSAASDQFRRVACRTRRQTQAPRRKSGEIPITGLRLTETNMKVTGHSHLRTVSAASGETLRALGSRTALCLLDLIDRSRHDSTHGFALVYTWRTLSSFLSPLE